MPTYEFICEKCKKPFTLIMKISEYEKKKFQCPKCKSRKVKQKITSFQTITSSKSLHLTAFQVILYLRFVNRFFVLSLFTAMASAFRVPTITTKSRPLVTAV